MEKAHVLQNIVLLPKRFYNQGSISIYSLLEGSGYFQSHAEINETDIFDELIRYPECIEQWLRWSENKRTSGWYFKKNENESYIIGYFPSQDDSRTLEYSDRVEACAVFIKKEIEAIRKNRD